MRPSSPFAAAAAALAVAIAGSAGAGADEGGCTKAASPGTPLQAFLDSVEPGDVACLHGGTFEGNVTMTRGGSGDATRVVVQSFPGERATIAGRLTVAQTADHVTFRDLDLDGHDAPACSAKETCIRLPSPTVNGDHVTFEDNDVTNRHVAICFNLGHHGYGRPQGVVIRRNRIHDCGRIDPVSNHDHGIYLAYSDDTEIVGNLIYDNADRGIQLYPDAQRTVIRGNVIDGNGEGVIFSGGGGTTSNDNVLEHNVITNSKIRHNVETWWPEAPGHGNVVRDNCVSGGRQGDIADQKGYEVSGNLEADPQYRDRAAKDFRLADGSPCAGILDAGLAERDAAPVPAEEPEPQAPEEPPPAQGSEQPQPEPQPGPAEPDPPEPSDAGTAEEQPEAAEPQPEAADAAPEPEPEPDLDSESAATAGAVIEAAHAVEPVAAAEPPPSPAEAPEPQVAEPAADPPIVLPPAPAAIAVPDRAPEPEDVAPPPVAEPEPAPRAPDITVVAPPELAIATPPPVVFRAPPPRDTRRPTIVVTSPRGGARYRKGTRVVARFSCRDDSGTLAACTASARPGRPLDTRKPGTRTFRVSARDGTGNTAVKLVRYVVTS